MFQVQITKTCKQCSQPFVIRPRCNHQVFCDSCGLTRAIDHGNRKRAERRAMGLCPYCGGIRDSSYPRCVDCRLMSRLKHRAWRASKSYPLSVKLMHDSFPGIPCPESFREKRLKLYEDRASKGLPLFTGPLPVDDVEPAAVCEPVSLNLSIEE